MITFVKLPTESTIWATDMITKIPFPNVDAFNYCQLQQAVMMTRAGYTDQQIKDQNTVLTVDPKFFRGCGIVEGYKWGDTVTIGGIARDCWGVPK